MRIIRLMLGLGILGQAIWQQQWLLGLVGIIITLFALANTACGAAGCFTCHPNTPTDLKTIKNNELKYDVVDESK